MCEISQLFFPDGLNASHPVRLHNGELLKNCNNETSLVLFIQRVKPKLVAVLSSLLYPGMKHQHTKHSSALFLKAVSSQQTPAPRKGLNSHFLWQSKPWLEIICNTLRMVCLASERQGLCSVCVLMWGGSCTSSLVLLQALLSSSPHSWGTTRQRISGCCGSQVLDDYLHGHCHCQMICEGRIYALFLTFAFHFIHTIALPITVSARKKFPLEVRHYFFYHQRNQFHPEPY